MANRITYQVGYQVDKTALNEIKASLQSLQLLTANDLMKLDKTMNLRQANEQLQQIKKSASEVSDALSRSFNTNLGTLNISKFNTELKKLDINRVYRDFSAAGVAGQTAFRNVTTQILTTNMQLKQTHSLLDSMAVTMRNTIKWSISSAVMNSFTGSIQQAYGYTKSLDRSLNDIRIVTQKSAEDMADFAVQANKAAQGLAASTTDYTNASLIYYQQGLDDEEVAARTEVTLKAANVTQQDTAEVSEQLTAVWNGYKVSAEEAELYVDKLAAVAASTASDLEELSTGMSRVASAAALMGVDVDQLNAQLSTIISVTRQAPESVGTALRSIYARMSDIEAGLDEETTLGSYTEEMNKYGINVLNAKNELRDMGEVIEEVGQKWTSMSREQQVALSQAMAGTRQYNNLLALFDNWDNYTKAIETSRNAVGTLQEQQDTYMEGTQAHLKQLKTAQEDLYDSLLKAEDINEVVDAFTKITNAATAFVDTVGGGKNVLFGLGAIVTQVFGKQFSSSIATSIINLQGLRDNAAKVSAQFEILQQFKGINIDDAATQKLIAMKEQVLEYGNIVTVEQQNQANELIRVTNELQNQKDAWEQTKQAAEQFYQQQTGQSLNLGNITDITSLNLYQQELKELGNEYKDVNLLANQFAEAFESARKASLAFDVSESDKDLEAFEKELARVNDRMEVYVSSVQEMVNANKAAPESITALKKVLNDYNTALSKSIEKSSSGGLGEALINDPKVKAAADQLVKVYTDAGNKIQQEAKRAAGTLKAEFEGASKDIENNLNTVDKSFQNMTQRWNVEQTVQQYVQLASTLGQVAFAYNSLTNVLNTWTNEDASFGEKISQTMIFIGTSLPMLINSFSRLNEVFGTTNLLVGAFNALKATSTSVTTAHVLAQTAENAQFTLTQAQIAKIIQEYYAYDAAVAGGAAAQSTANVANQIAIKLQGILGMNLKQINAQYKEQIISIVELIQAEKIDNGVKAKGIALQEAWNASLLANPIVLVIAALSALVIGIHAYIAAEEKAIQRAVDSARARRDEALAIEEENNEIQGLYNTYSKFYSTYNKTGDNKDELREATEKLCEALQIEIDTLDLLSDSYDNVNRKIAEARQTQAKEALDKAQTGLDNAGMALMRGNSDSAAYDDSWSTIQFDAGAAGNDEQQVSDFLADRLEALNLDMQVNRSGTISQDFYVNNIKTIEDFVTTYEAIKQAYEDMATEFKDDRSVLDDSEIYQSLHEWLSDSKEDYEAYIQLQDDIKTYAKEFAEATAQLQSEDFDMSKISSIEEFESYRNQYIQALEETFKAEGLQYTQEELEQYANDYLSTLDAISGYVQQFNIKEELEQRLSGTKEEIDAFIKELEENGELELAATLTINEGDSVENVREALEKLKAEMLKSSVMEGSVQIKTVMDGVQSGEINYKNILENEDYQELMKNLQNVRKEYPEIEAAVQELDKTWEVGTQKYLEALEIVQDKLASLNFKYLEDAANEAADAAQQALDDITDEETGEIIVDADTEAFENAMDELLDREYEIDIAVHTEAEQEFESIINAMDDIYNKADMIGESFIVAADDIRELNNTFPGIIEGMTQLADGTIQLNEDVARSAINAAETEAAADADAAVEKLKNQAILLRSKQQVYLQMAEAARVLAGTEVDSEMTANEAIAKLNGGLSDLKQLNSQITSQSEMDNQEEVANSSNSNALVTAQNWAQGFQAAAVASAQFANDAIANMQAAASGSGTGTVGNYAVNYQGASGTSQEASILEQTQNALDSATETSNDVWANLAGKYQNLADSAGAAANDIEGMIAQIGATGHELDHAFDNVRSGHGTKNSKDKKGKDPDYMDYLEDEADRYHDINLELEDLEAHLNKLDKQQKKLYGKDLIKNLNEQLDILEKQKAAYQVKLDIAKAEAQELRNMLAMQGVSFDSEGYMTNYANALQSKLNYVNSVIAQYNAMSAEEQEKFKDTVEAAKKDYETFQSQMERYDELISSFIPDIEDSIQDAVDKEIEINIQKFTMEVELRLDMAEAERDFNEFKRKVIDGIKDEDILGNTQSKLKDYASYFDTNGYGVGPVQKLTDQINDTMDQIKQIDNSGWADTYGDNKAQAMEDLQKYYEELMQQLEDIVDLVDEIKESYLDMIDEAVEAFDKQVDQYEYIKDLLDHDMNIIGLVYGDKAYAQMTQYYEQIEKNNNQELDFLKKRVAYAEEMMQKETDPKAKEKWEEEWMDALEKLNDKVEDSIQNLVDKYQNAINQAFDELNKKVTNGKGLDYVNDEWDLINKNADQYLDTINSLYAIQDLENKYLEALDQTDSLSAQQKLNDMMNEQLGMLKDKDKLTQYDVDRANMMYEIALKQIALEEAQQNKSKMRLRRDSQGNYSYQFVADEDSIAQAQQDLLAAQNDLYNFDKDKYKENLNEIYEYYVEFQQKYADIMSDMSLTDEERQERAKLLQEQYGTLINGLVEQNETIKQNLHESTFMTLEGLYAADAESFKEMTGKDIEAFRNLTDTEKDLIINDLIPQWDSGVQHMADVFAKEGGLIPTCKNAFEELDQATRDYQDSLDDLEAAAGVDFDSISAGYDENIEKAQDLLYANDDLINKYMEEIDAILEVISQLDDLIAKYEEAQAAAVAATEAAYAFVTAQKEAAAAASGTGGGGSSGGSDSSGGGDSGSGNSSGRGGGDSGSGGDGVPKVGDVVTYTGGLYYYDSYGTKPTGSRGPGKKVTITNLNPGAPKPIHVQSSDSAYGWLTQNQISGYDTGGYTGSWGNSNGKLAVLHQKELILNAQDTENMLTAVSIVRDIAGVLDNMQSSMMSRVMGLSSGFNTPISDISAASDTLEQDVHIEAHFPNVQNSSEIEDAFNNLVNIASQRAYRTKR